jgi:hypothetical protein
LSGRRFLKKFPELPITLLRRGDHCKKGERIKTFSGTGGTDFSLVTKDRKAAGMITRKDILNLLEIKADLAE